MLASVLTHAQTGGFSDSVSTSNSAVGSINPIGDYYELVIPIGFIDRKINDTLVYPFLYNDSTFLTTGVFLNGTALVDSINTLGGQLDIEAWFKPQLDHYFDFSSNGSSTLEVDFIRKTNGEPYTPYDSLQYFIDLEGSDYAVIKEQYEEICSQVLEQVEDDFPTLFNNADAFHFVFHVGSTSKREFFGNHGGTVKILNYDGTDYPISINYKSDAIIHERLHLLGLGDKKGVYTTGPYDVMSNWSVSPTRYSLFNQRPLIGKELVDLGWVGNDEILTITKSNYLSYAGSIKITDLNYALTSQQKSQGYYRIVRVMADSAHNEYFQAEFHNASGYDKFFHNYTEYASGGYNKGLLLWHLRHDGDIDDAYDHEDLEVAVPYMAWEGRTPIPNDGFPYISYTRPSNWPHILDEGDPDYLNDLRDTSTYIYRAHGGKPWWATKLDDPPTSWAVRNASKRSDFFTDQTIQGEVVQSISDYTTPSTRKHGYYEWVYVPELDKYDWVPRLPSNSKLRIFDIERVGSGSSMYMTFDVEYDTTEVRIPQDINVNTTLIPGTYYRNPVINWSKVVVAGETVEFYNVYKARVNPTGFSLFASTGHTVFCDTTEVIQFFGQSGRTTDNVYYYVTTVFQNSPESDESDTVHVVSNMYFL